MWPPLCHIKRPSSDICTRGVLEDFLEEVISKLGFGWMNLKFIMHDREKGIPVRGNSVQSTMMV